MMVKDKHKRMTVDFLEGLLIGQELKEGRGNNRSVMPLDVRGRTRATLKEAACLYPCLKRLGNPWNFFRDWDRGLQLFPLNEEFPVSASHKLALITSLPFVHTARRSYRLGNAVKIVDVALWFMHRTAESI